MKISRQNIIPRLMVILVLLVPFFFFGEFYEHFRAYLTGTILNNIITHQWKVVVISIVLFSLFLIPISFRRKAKWAEYSLVTAFFISLFIEMYGVPLTILFASKYFFTDPTLLPPNVIEFSWIGVDFGMDHAMLYAAIIMMLGTVIILIGWITLYKAQKHNVFVTSGIYKYSRHPQYIGFLMVIIGWFIGWPTILTAIFTPILVYKYIKVALTEEREIVKMHPEYDSYRKKTPLFM